MFFKIEFFVPKESAEHVKSALFKAGAGKIGNYDCCSWETEGKGQFKPLLGAHPSMGKINQLEFIQELKIELICDETVLQDSLQALIASHPYETPAYQYWPINPPIS